MRGHQRIHFTQRQKLLYIREINHAAACQATNEGNSAGANAASKMIGQSAQ
jgi:hypothetical protein